MKTLFLLLGMLGSMSIYAQEGFQQMFNDTSQKKWTVVLSPYALLAAQSTDVGGEQLRQSFNDLSSITNAGFQLDALVRYNRWVLSIDGTYANLQADQNLGFATVDFNLDQWIVDSKVGYLVYSTLDFSKTDEVIRGWSIEGNVGLKYWKNDVNINLILPPVLGGGTEEIPQAVEWSDLMLGARARIILNRRVMLGIQGDIGGFGIGNSAQLSWDLTYINVFQVTKTLGVTAGFRSFNYKRVDVNNGESTSTRVSVVGPLLGVSIYL